MRTILRVLLAGLVVIPTAAVAKAGDSTQSVEGVLESGVESHLVPPETPEELYASDYQVTIDVARERLLAQQDIAQALEEASTKLGEERLSGLWIDHTEDGLIGWLSVTGDDPLPADVVEIVTTQGLGVRYGDSFSRSELVDALATLEVEDPVAFVDVNERLNSVRMGVLVGTPDLDQYRQLLGDIPIHVEEVSGPVEHMALMRGGERMVHGVPPFAACTSGFAVRNSAGVRGVLTAGHCPNTPFYQNNKPMPFMAEAWSTSADVQWHRVNPGDTVAGQYRCSSGQPPLYCDVNAWSTTNTGMYVCHTGTSSGTSCGTVQSVTYMPGNLCLPPGYTSPCAANFIWSHGPSLRGCGGDSGGPLFRTGGYVHGIVKAGTDGTNCVPSGKHIIYSKLGPIHSGLQVTTLFAGQ